MRIKETTVFQYQELSDDSKARARGWYRAGMGGDDYFSESVIESAEQVGVMLGIQFGTTPVKLMNGATRDKVRIYWSLGSRADGASFDGYWSAQRVQHGNAALEWPTDAELKGIASRFEWLSTSYPQSGFSVCASGRGIHSLNTNFSIDMGLDDNDWPSSVQSKADAELALQEVARDFMDWIYHNLRVEWEYQHSEECITDNLIANGYEFLESGKPA